MRIKFLSVIVSFLIVSFALSSCLDSDDNYEFSSDATIHAFGIDTIHGKHYKFTIDQLNRLIYNRDSLPVGSDTIIDRILIDTMTVTGWITSGSPTDTVFVISDSVDLRPAMNNDAGMLFKAHAADGVTVREYKLKVNVHLQDPDSLVWTDMQKRGNVFSNTINSGQQKAVVCVYMNRFVGNVEDMMVACFVIILIRYLAAHYRWNLPRLHNGSEQ